MINIQAPPILSGTEAQQLLAVRNYLFTMYRQLNQALNNLDETNFTEGGAARTVVAGGLGKGAAAEVGQQTSALRSLIIKNANYVKSEIDRIDTRLESNYEALSDYGAFTQSISADLAATAEKTETNYNYTASLSSDFNEYVKTTSGHIAAGIVGYEDDAITPIFGVAVGQGITTTDVTINGETQQEINPNNFLSVFTAKKLAFMQNGAEVAYLSNEKLYITTAHIEGKLEFSNKWSIDTAKGFTVKWVG